MDTKQSGQIFQLIPKIMREVGVIGKNRRNPQQGYAFRGIDDIYNAIQTHFAENGVFCAPEVTEQLREERQTKSGGNLIYTVLRVKHTFYAPDGSNFSAVTVGEAMDSGDKSANKAMSAAMKYALIEVFAIPTEGDNDTENNAPETSQRKPATAQKPVVVAPVPMSKPEFEKAMQELDAAWTERGFDVEAADQILLKVLKAQKLPNIQAAPRAFIERMIANIKEGKYDKLKPVPAGAAN